MKKHYSSHPAKDTGFPVFAAIDLGTNNCRLLVAQSIAMPSRAEQGIRVLDTFSRVVRLGEGVSATQQLSPDAMTRTIMALKACQSKLARHDVVYSRYVATEACRRASNRAEFIARVKEEAGITIEVISNEEEAKLAFLGCSTLLSPACDQAIVFDIGGGSTEFMWVRRDPATPPEMLCDFRIMDWLSLDRGVMNLSEEFGGSAFAEVYFNELVEYLVKRLRDFDKKNKIGDAIRAGKVQMLSTSGTMTTLAALHLGLTHYERSRVDGFTFSSKDLRAASRKVLSMSPSKRFANQCIGADRAEYVVSGCAILEAIYTLWPAPEVTIGDRGVREGIILSLMQEYTHNLLRGA
jgi:exopolyphosphatase / guanosine-5'-triphosphate,3'-diphosphate pyrophosphatase